MKAFKKALTAIIIMLMFALAGFTAHQHAHFMGGHQTWEQAYQSQLNREKDGIMF